MARALDRYFETQTPGGEGQPLSYESTPPRALDKYFQEAAPEPSSTVNKAEPAQGVRGFLERKVAAPLAELAIHGATSIPETVKGVSGLANKGINAILNYFGLGMTPENVEKATKIINSLGPFGQMPDREQLKEGLKSVTGGRLEPTTPTERILKGGAGIVGDIAGFGPGAIVESPTAALATAAMAGTTAALEEKGVPPAFALGGGILVDIATRSGSSLMKRLAQTFQKGATKTVAETAAKVGKLAPEQVRNEVLAAGERLGIKSGEVPLSAALDSPVVQSVETKLRESSLSGRHLSKQIQNLQSKAKTAYEDVAAQLSARTSLLPAAISEEAVSQLKNIEKQAADVYTNYYNRAAKLLPKGAVIEERLGKPILRHLDQKIEQLSKGAGTPAKDAIKNRLERLRSDWTKRYPNGAIPVEDLIELKKDLNEIIKYEVRGGVDKMLTPLQHMTRNAIQKYGTKNQPFAFSFNEAERYFADSAKNFRKNKAVNSILQTQNPEALIGKMRNVKTYREFRDLYSRTPEGKEAFKDMSRYLLEDMIGNKILSKKGDLMWGHTAGMLKNPKNRELIREIVGDANFKKLKDLATLSGGIEEGLKKFANSSQTATKGFDIALILGTLGKGITQIFSGHPIQGAKSMSYILAPRVMARAMSSPELIDAMIAAARAGKGNNPSKFFDAANEAARLAIPIITHSYEEPGKAKSPE